METNNELMHYGVLGMKWGVRRYQNKDGTLTNKGRKRVQHDVQSLSKAMSKHLDSTNDFQRSITKTYLVDKSGFNRWSSDGKGYFDTSGGVTQYNAKALAAKKRNEEEYLKIKNLMKKTYDSVVVNAKYDIETGKASAKIILEKNGERFVSEFAKDYGAFDTSKTIKFAQMYK